MRDITAYPSLSLEELVEEINSVRLAIVEQHRTVHHLQTDEVRTYWRGYIDAAQSNSHNAREHAAKYASMEENLEVAQARSELQEYEFRLGWLNQLLQLYPITHTEEMTQAREAAARASLSVAAPVPLNRDGRRHGLVVPG
jgi:hypothetical protein